MTLRPSRYRFFIEDSYAGVVIIDAACLNKLTGALVDYDAPLSLIVVDGEPPAQPNAYSFDQLLAAHAGELPPAGTHRNDGDRPSRSRTC